MRQHVTFYTAAPLEHILGDPPWNVGVFEIVAIQLEPFPLASVCAFAYPFVSRSTFIHWGHQPILSVDVGPKVRREWVCHPPTRGSAVRFLCMAHYLDRYGIHRKRVFPPQRYFLGV